MSEDRRQILQMLADGQIKTEEAERLLNALEHGNGGGADGRAAPKFLRVEVDSNEGRDGPTKVNVRVPMLLLRAGMRLSQMIPPQARDKVDSAMREKGVGFDLSQVKPENLDELIAQMNDLTVNIDSDKAKVRVYCE